jgi:hypothetical protein
MRKLKSPAPVTFSRRSGQCCVQVIKASAAAVVHNWNDQHTTGDWTRSLRSRVSATSAMSGRASLSFCHDFLFCRRKVRVDQHYDASGLGITTKSPG